MRCDFFLKLAVWLILSLWFWNNFVVELEDEMLIGGSLFFLVKWCAIEILAVKIMCQIYLTLRMRNDLAGTTFVVGWLLLDVSKAIDLVFTRLWQCNNWCFFPLVGKWCSLKQALKIVTRSIEKFCGRAFKVLFVIPSGPPAFFGFS